jgi:hypothetical protein
MTSEPAGAGKFLSVQKSPFRVRGGRWIFSDSCQQTNQPRLAIGPNPTLRNRLRIDRKKSGVNENSPENTQGKECCDEPPDRL